MTAAHITMVITSHTSVTMVIDCWLDYWSSTPDKRNELFLLRGRTRPALGLIQLPTQMMFSLSRICPAILELDHAHQLMLRTSCKERTLLTISANELGRFTIVTEFVY